MKKAKIKKQDISLNFKLTLSKLIFIVLTTGLILLIIFSRSTHAVPLVTVSHSPSNPMCDENVKITAFASSSPLNPITQAKCYWGYTWIGLLNSKEMTKLSENNYEAQIGYFLGDRTIYYKAIVTYENGVKIESATQQFTTQPDPYGPSLPDPPDPPPQTQTPPPYTPPDTTPYTPPDTHDTNTHDNDNSEHSTTIPTRSAGFGIVALSATTLIFYLIFRRIKR